MIIAIDGPAGSGKSTVSKVVAKRLGFLYVDTGAMYRALTLKAMKEKADFGDENALVKIAKNASIELVADKNNNLKVFLDKKDVTEAIRTPKLTKNIKFVAQLADVRKEMVKMQRRVAGSSNKGAVLEGRDIGTAVFPDADYKFYLDADLGERVKRRHNELVEAGQNVSLSEVEKDARERDKSDMTRSVGPLKKADDAIIIDTTKLSVGEVADGIVAKVQS